MLLLLYKERLVHRFCSSDCSSSNNTFIDSSVKGEPRRWVEQGQSIQLHKAALNMSGLRELNQERRREARSTITPDDPHKTREISLSN